MAIQPKRTHVILLVLIVSMTALGLSVKEQQTSVNYYFSSTSGNDDNNGLSKDSPMKSLAKVSELNLMPGDSILLASGDTFNGSISLEKVKGTSEKPIVISTYDLDFAANVGKAKINARGFYHAIYLENCSFVHLNNLAITASRGNEESSAVEKEMSCGILIKINEPGLYEQIYMSNLKLYDIFYRESGFERGTVAYTEADAAKNYGWGIRVINKKKGAQLRDLRIDSCTIENIAHTGIKMSSRKINGVYGIVGFQISNNKVLGNGGPGMQMSGVKNGHIVGNIIDRAGSFDDPRKKGRGSGLWTWGSDSIMIEKNRFTNAKGPADSAGAHIDYNCSNVVMQYNFSANNAGGFCEILGNNYNCAYRYNISVNDGYRIKGKNGGHNSGKVFWLSGYCRKVRKGPYNSYFYNNTIYVKKELDARMGIDKVSDGVLIANNIFHIEGEAKGLGGKHFDPENEEEWLVSDVFFENNLYFSQSSWPGDFRVQDGSPVYGDAQFANGGGNNLADYKPNNRAIVVNKGINIPMLSKDSIGLIYGLDVEFDILGNKISETPDMGAIELE